MFEGPGLKKQEDIIDIFNKYKGALTEYVDKVVYARAGLNKYVSEDDKKKVAERKREAERTNENENYETHLRAKIFEGVLIKHGNEIFGESARTIITSEYDDWENGADMILEGKQEGGKPIRVAIDAALSMDTRNINKKNDLIFNELERLDIPSKKEFFSLKYFSPTGGKPEEIHSIPRVVLGIHSENFNEVLDDVRGGKKGISELRRIFLTMMKNQLENQFVVALGTNGEKMDSKERNGERLSPEFTKDTRDLYPLSKKAVKNGWKEKDINTLFSLFLKNRTIFSMKQLSLPEYYTLLENISEAWEWTRKELLDDDVKYILKEDQTDWEHNEVVEKLEEHLDEDRALKHRPFLAA